MIRGVRKVNIDVNRGSIIDMGTPIMATMSTIEVESLVLFRVR
jgi:hypothetical protein